MTTTIWNGAAQAVAQVSTATPANVEVGDTFVITINGKSVSYTAAAATVADVVAGLASAVNDSTIPEFEQITATDTGTEVTLTGDESGRPFVAASSTVNGGASNTQTLTLATSTQATGPYHWDNADNWSAGAVPGDGDDVFFEDSDTSILYGMDQASVTLGSLNIRASFTGQVGLPRLNVDTAEGYTEYLDRFLRVGAATIDIGRGDGEGSRRIQIDTGTTSVSITVHSAGLPAESDLPTVLWKGDHPGNALHVLDGAIGVALFGGETATLATLTVAGGDVRCGAGTALSAIDCSGSAQLVVGSTVTTLDQSGGHATALGDAAIGTLNLIGGTLDFRSNGSISGVTVDGPGAVLDFSASLRPRTVGAASLVRGTVLDPHQTVTWTNGVQPGRHIVAT